MSIRRTRNAYVYLLLAAALLLLAAGVVVLAGNQGRSGPWIRGMSLPAALLLTLAVGLGAPLAVGRWFRRPGRRGSDAASRSAAEPVPGTLAASARLQAERAGEFIDRVNDPSQRAKLARELARLHAERQEELNKLSVVVFGTVSAGKTSLINALIGQEVGKTEAVMGTTLEGAAHTYQLRSVDALVELTDTPGMSEAGEGGEARETLARSLAVRADLLLFVVDHDLIRSEYTPLVELARLGKRSIVVLNKKDQFPDADLAAIRSRLRERLSGVIEPEDIVAVAAAPRPLPVRIQRGDGTFETVIEKEDPDIAGLLSRMVELLRGEGKLLHAMNLLVRGRVLEQEAQEQLRRERERRAIEVVDQHQWITAATVFANPIPALDILSGGAVQLEMIAELARAGGGALGRPGARAGRPDGAIGAQARAH